MRVSTKKEAQIYTTNLGSKGRFGLRVGKFVDTISTYVQIGFLVLVAGLIVSWAIPPVRDRLLQGRWFDEHTMNEAVALALLLTMGLLHHLYRQMTEVSHELKHLIGMGSNIIHGGVGQVYPHLLGALESGGRGRRRSLEVLGLTLYTAWPQIHAWISEGSAHDLDITLYCLEPEFIVGQSNWIPQYWENHAKAQIDSIRRFTEENAQDIKARSIAINLIRYSGFPAIHGFRLGSGELFISFSWWSGDFGNRHLGDPNHFYERFRADDRSARAEEYRSLFGNWIDEARSRGIANLPSSSKAPPGLQRPRRRGEQDHSI
jgi:hypothetical protein